MSAPILEVRNLRVSIAGDEGIARILDHVEFTIQRGRILGLVGESGCGKSTLIRAILGILPPRSSVEQGSIRFADKQLLALDERALERDVRGRAIGFVPQDPYLALNPVFTVGSQLLAAMQAHSSLPRSQQRDHLTSLMQRMRLRRPETLLDRYPHQLSGGQRQRMLIAGALALKPQLIVADEPTTALDSITQRQILGLLRELVRDLDLSLLFVTHDLGAAAQLCDDIGVMYAGQIVEFGPAASVLRQAKHPYTSALIGCHPERTDRPTGIAGQVPSPLRAPPGCRFAPRCGAALPACNARKPMLNSTGHDNHLVDCRLFDA